MQKWYFIFAIILFGGCKKKVEDPPKSRDQDGLSARIQRIKASKLTFPLDFPIQELSVLLNEALPDVLVDDTLRLKKEGEYVSIKIVPIGQMLLASYNNNLDASIPMKVTAEIEKKLLGIKTHQSIDFQVRVDMNTKLVIGEDWNLTSQCKIQKVHWIEPPVIDVLGIKINLQNQIDKKLLEKAGDIEDKICQELPKLVPLKDQVTKIWSIISRAHRIGKKPIDIWLTSNPSMFTAHFSKDVRDTLRVILHAESEIYITPIEGLKYDEKPMPPNPSHVLSSENELDIEVDVYLPYEKMNEVLKSKLDSSSVSYEGASVFFTNFNTGTREGKLHLQFDVKGDIDATIDALAYPSLDDEKNLIIDSISYEIESDNGLLYLAEWIASDQLSAFLKANSKVPLSRTLDSLDYKIVEALNKSNLGRKVELDIAFTSLKSDTLVFTNEGLQWFFDVEGKAHAFLTKELIEK